MNHKIDLRGTPCPLNYVKTKLKLEEIKSNELLEVLLDDGEAVKNVPPSVRRDGNKILSLKNINNGWKLTIKKN